MLHLLHWSIYTPKLSDFSLDLHRSLAAEGFAKILDRAMGMPALFANPTPSRSRHISSGKIAQLMYKYCHIYPTPILNFIRSLTIFYKSDNPSTMP